MTREETIHKWVLPALKNTWNEKKCEEILKALEQEPNAGHWIKIQKTQKGCHDCTVITYEYHCSECDCINVSPYKKFCPNCGCAMEGRTEE